MELLKSMGASWWGFSLTRYEGPIKIDPRYVRVTLVLLPMLLLLVSTLAIAAYIIIQNQRIEQPTTVQSGIVSTCFFIISLFCIGHKYRVVHRLFFALRRSKVGLVKRLKKQLSIKKTKY